MKVTLDIGGSKTRGFLLSAQETRSFELLGGYGRAQDADAPIAELSAALKEVLSADAFGVDAVAVNLGGKNKRQIVATVKAVFPGAKVCVYRESEGVVASRILARYGADVLLMAGTGCIAFARMGERMCVVGGWGKDFSDEGSGYDIGATAVKCALKELDGTAPLSLLTKELLGVQMPFAFSSVSAYTEARDAVRACIPKTREGVAALTRVVVSCARAGCDVSLEILRKRGQQMAELARCAAEKLGIDHPKMVINGGIVSFKELWQSAFAQNTVYITDGIDAALKEIAEELI